MDITFDPNTPTMSRDYFDATYLYSGGDTSIRIQIGNHVSVPINRFSMEVFQYGDTSSTINAVLVAGYDPGNNLDVAFPGYLDGGNAFVEFFAPRIGFSYGEKNELPAVQPAPLLYPVLARFSNYTAQDVPPGVSPIVTFNAAFTSIPEPSGMSTAVAALCVFIGCGRLRRPHRARKSR